MTSNDTSGDRALVEVLAWMRRAAGPMLPSDQPPIAFGGAASTSISTRDPSSGVASEQPSTSVKAHRSASSTPSLSSEERSNAMQRLAADAASCTRCVLCETRNQVVFGEGSLKPRLVVVGEGPGAKEDQTGRPFVGPAGQLLDRMLAAIGLDRTSVYICNVVKCRPPSNRDPRPGEVGACRPFLDEQLRLLDPELVLTVGAPASRTVLQTQRGITSLRGRIHTTSRGLRVLPTFHPAYLLRNPAAKRDAWADMKKVAALLEIEIPSRR